MVVMLTGVTLATTTYQDGFVALDNISMNGKYIKNLPSPINDTDAATKLTVTTANNSMKAYVDVGDHQWTKLNKTGDTMSGALAMGANKVTGVANGTAAQDGVTYSQLYGTRTLPLVIDTGSDLGFQVGNFASNSAMASINFGNNSVADSSQDLCLNLYINTTKTVGTPHATVGGIWIRQEQYPGFTGDGWGSTIWLTDLSAEGNWHGGYYARIEGNGGGTLWGMALETRDHVEDVTGTAVTLVGLESVTEMKNAGSTAVGIHILAKGTYNSTTGVKIDGDGGRMYSTGLEITKAKTWAIRGVSTSNVGLSLEDGTYTDAAIRLKYGQIIDLGGYSNARIVAPVGGGSIEFYVGGTRRAYCDSTGMHNG